MNGGADHTDGEEASRDRLPADFEAVALNQGAATAVARSAPAGEQRLEVVAPPPTPGPATTLTTPPPSRPRHLRAPWPLSPSRR